MASSAMGLFPEIKVKTFTTQKTIAAGATEPYDFGSISSKSAVVIGVKIESDSHWFTWTFGDFSTYQVIRIKNESASSKVVKSVTVY